MMATKTATKITALRVRMAKVPIVPAIETAAGEIKVAPLVLVDLFCGKEIVGRSYVFTYTPAALAPTAKLVSSLATSVVGQELAPADLWRRLRAQLRLLGTEGLVGMALAAIDMAAWDALAKTAKLPLARLLGARGDMRTRAYATLRAMRPEAAQREAEAALARGFGAVKIRLGFPTLEEDLAAVTAMRRAIGESAGLMVDYNQSLRRVEAARRLRALEHLGLLWVEEPLAADDDSGHAALAREMTTPIQLGENWWGPGACRRSLEAGAARLAMLDAMKIGGVTGWREAAAHAAGYDAPVSSHLFVEASAQLLAATSGADWLEYLDLAAPILAAPLAIEDGAAILSDAPGLAIAWNEAALARFAVK
jgi:mandelate racemase